MHVLRSRMLSGWAAAELLGEARGTVLVCVYFYYPKCSRISRKDPGIVGYAIMKSSYLCSGMVATEKYQNCNSSYFS